MKQILLFYLDEAQHVALPNSLDVNTRNAVSQASVVLYSLSC